MSVDARVLDLRCAVGGLLVHAGLGGARSILAFESDPDALDLARENAEANGLVGRARIEPGTPSAALESVQEHFDLVLLDVPPPTPGSEPAAAFSSLVRGAMRTTRRGGRMIVVGYHPPLPPGGLDGLVAEACEHGRRFALRLARPSLPADFPTPVGSPAGEHLSALALELD